EAVVGARLRDGVPVLRADRARRPERVLPAAADDGAPAGGSGEPAGADDGPDLPGLLRVHLVLDPRGRGGVLPCFQYLADRPAGADLPSDGRAPGKPAKASEPSPPPPPPSSAPAVDNPNRPRQSPRRRNRRRGKGR